MVSETDTARPALDERGEMQIELDGVAAVLRPSYEAIAAFEADTGKSLIELSRNALAGTMTTADAAHVVCQCVRAWGRETGDKGWSGANAPRIGHLIMEGPGLFATLVTLGGLLSMAATGGYTAQGKAKAATTSPQTDGQAAAG